MTDTSVAPLTKKDFVSDQDVRWCPGCGDYSILAQTQKTMPDLGIPKEKIVFNYVPEDHSYNKELGKEFSVYQEMYYMDESLDAPPSLDRLLHKDRFMGYKLKYNINETYYYMNKSNTEHNYIQKTLGKLAI